MSQLQIIGAGPRATGHMSYQAWIGSTLVEAATSGRPCLHSHLWATLSTCGHRFFSKLPHALRYGENWADFLSRPRLSRIHYRGHFFDYPLRATNALAGLGPLETLLVTLSYAKAKFFPNDLEETFEQWVSNRFGYRLYEIFFKTYTEKVWGLPCSEISADWAAQRIKNLSLKEAVATRCCSRNGKSPLPYPRLSLPPFGPGYV